MIIDIVDVLRYESDVVPSVGQTITVLPKTYLVESVDHLLGTVRGRHIDDPRPRHMQQLVTVTVQEMNDG